MKFYVDAQEIHIQTYEIEAKDEDEAREKINKMRETGDDEKYMCGEIQYSRTIEPDEWSVMEKADS